MKGFTRRQLLAQALFAVAAMPVAAKTRPRRRKVRFLAVGNSITAGGGASDGATRGFVALLQRRFPEFEIINVGCAGSTIRDWTRDFVGLPAFFCVFGNAWASLAAPELPVQVFHLMLGTNDSTGFFEAFPGAGIPHGNFVPPDEHDRRLRDLIGRMNGLILLSVPPIPTSLIGGPAGDRMEAYRDIVHRIVEEFPNVVLGGDFQALLGPSDMVGVHPNDVGHERMADEIERNFLALLSLPGSRRTLPITQGTILRIRIHLWRQFIASHRRLTGRGRNGPSPVRPSGQ